MKIATINASEDHDQYIGQIYQEHYTRLRHYFLVQLGNASEADDCVHETIRYLFFFMEERDWEAETEYIFVYLMRIAGNLCSKKLGEKRLQRTPSLDNARNSLFNKIRAKVSATMKERMKFIRSVLRPVTDNGRQLSEI